MNIYIWQSHISGRVICTKVSVNCLARSKIEITKTDMCKSL
jgi:hypothetical protein